MYIVIIDCEPVLVSENWKIVSEFCKIEYIRPVRIKFPLQLSNLTVYKLKQTKKEL